MGTPSSPPRVSVVVNTYNRAASLHQTLQALRRQNYPNLEVIVVNGPSTDSTIEVLRRHSAEIRVGYCEQRNLSISRNVGIEMARGEFVAFIDSASVRLPPLFAESHSKRKAREHELCADDSKQDLLFAEERVVG